MNERRMAAQQRSNRRSSRRSSYSPPRGGGADMGTVSTPTRKANPVLVARAEAEQRQADETNRRIAANREVAKYELTPPKRKTGILSKADTVANFLGPFVDPREKAGKLIQLYKLLRGDDQAYRGGDIQSWDEDDVSGLGSFNLADMGITTPGTDYTQLAKVYSTKDITDLLGIKDQATAEKYVEDPYVGSPKFIGDKSQANIMEKFRENLLEQETKFPTKSFDAQRSAAQTLGISPTNRSLIPSDFLNQPGEAATQMPFKNIAAEIEKKYPMARGGLINFFKYGGYLG
jgi:hypothetical protein